MPYADSPFRRRNIATQNRFGVLSNNALESDNPQNRFGPNLNAVACCQIPLAASARLQRSHKSTRAAAEAVALPPAILDLVADQQALLRDRVLTAPRQQASFWDNFLALLVHLAPTTPINLAASPHGAMKPVSARLQQRTAHANSAAVAGHARSHPPHRPRAAAAARARRQAVTPEPSVGERGAAADLLNFIATKGRQVADTLAVFADPVLDPSTYLADIIARAVTNFGGDPRLIHSNRSLQVMLDVPRQARQTIIGTLEIPGPHNLFNCTLLEILTGEYKRRAQPLLTDQIRIVWPADFPDGLGVFLQQLDPQPAYLADLDRYFSRTEVAPAFRQWLRWLTRARVGNYVAERVNPQGSAAVACMQANKDYLLGRDSAYSVELNGERLLNVFFIKGNWSEISPTATSFMAVGTLFSVMDERSYDVIISPWAIIGLGIDTNPVKFLIEHLSPATRARRQGTRFETRIRESGLESRISSGSMRQLAWQAEPNLEEQQFNDFKARFKSDINALIKSQGEAERDYTVAVLDSIGAVLGIMAVPATLGTLPLGISTALTKPLASLALNGATSIVPNFVQYGYADRPYEAHMYLKNAIFGLVLEGIGALAGPSLIPIVESGRIVFRHTSFNLAKLSLQVRRIARNMCIPLPRSSSRVLAPARAEDLRGLGAIGDNFNLRYIDDSVSSTSMIAPLVAEINRSGPLRTILTDQFSRSSDTAKTLHRIFTARGFKVETGGMYVWRGSFDTAPRNHFVSRLSKDGRQVVIDLTAGDFNMIIDWNLHRQTYAIVETQVRWLERFSTLTGTRHNLISLQWFDQPSAAFRAYPAHPNHVPFDLPGYPKVAQPAWYKTTMQERYFAEIGSSFRNTLVARAAEEASVLSSATSSISLGARRFETSAWPSISLRLPYMGLSGRFLREAIERQTVALTAIGDANLHSQLLRGTTVLVGIDLRGLQSLIGPTNLRYPIKITDFGAPDEQAGIVGYTGDKADRSIQQAYRSARWSPVLERHRGADLELALATLQRPGTIKSTEEWNHLTQLATLSTASQERLDQYEAGIGYQAGQHVPMPIVMAVDRSVDPAASKALGNGTWEISKHIGLRNIRFLAVPLGYRNILASIMATLLPPDETVPVVGIELGSVHPASASAGSSNSASEFESTSAADGKASIQEAIGRFALQPNALQAIHSFRLDRVLAVLDHAIAELNRTDSSLLDSMKFGLFGTDLRGLTFMPDIGVIGLTNFCDNDSDQYARSAGWIRIHAVSQANAASTQAIHSKQWAPSREQSRRAVLTEQLARENQAADEQQRQRFQQTDSYRLMANYRAADSANAASPELLRVPIVAGIARCRQAPIRDWSFTEPDIPAADLKFLVTEERHAQSLRTLLALIPDGDRTVVYGVA